MTAAGRALIHHRERLRAKELSIVCQPQMDEILRINDEVTIMRDDGPVSASDPGATDQSSPARWSDVAVEPLPAALGNHAR